MQKPLNTPPKNPSAFPNPAIPAVEPGMTLRDYFAAAALPQIIADGAIGMQQDCEAAYAYADAMLAERSRTNA